MSEASVQWQVQSIAHLPESFLQAVQQQSQGLPGSYAAQLLWQRGIRDADAVERFLNVDRYQPTSPFAFGEEMTQAIARLGQARDRGEKIAIWGDFDADGITATSVLWEGLGQFFSQHDRLVYVIPNRLKESHGLAIAGIQNLAEQGCTLIITCDTGSTNREEIEFAKELGLDLIVTDHHTLPEERPPVVAIVNPRYLPTDHPLAYLSGVAVAYKLIEALYQTFPDVPQQPLEELLDLVAIGLIADLVQLTGDCRYLAKKGIDRLQQTTRPGILKLLELCKRSGDRPTDISFGIGPRINAISRIHGDARFGVELLTSREVDRCRQLAEETELANARRKSLQKEMLQQAKQAIAHLDLSTTSAIVLSDPQWEVGILGLVAGQIAQEYGRPTILLTPDPIVSASNSSPDAINRASTAIPNPQSLIPNPQSPIPNPQSLARGSARSANQIDLYELVKNQQHLLHRFGGHPFAAGLSLPVENIPLFTEAINRQLREKQFADGTISGAVIQADLAVTIAELGKDLFKELKLLEPCGMGNPTPKLLIQNCWFEAVRNRNINDWKGRKVQYIKTTFEICDESCDVRFPGVWWGHYQDEIPSGRCDAIAELDFNTYTKNYEIRLLALRRSTNTDPIPTIDRVDWLLDWRNSTPEVQPEESVLTIDRCPSSWDELQIWFRRAIQKGCKLAIAYPAPAVVPPSEIWKQLIGLAKYLSRTGKTATRSQILHKLEISDRPLQLGFQCLKQLGFDVRSSEQGFQMQWNKARSISSELELTQHTDQFFAAIQEEQFRRQYFYQVPFATIQIVAQQISR